MEPLLNISDAKFNYEDLDGNKEVLGPQLDKNSDGREAAKQKHKAKDNQFITFSVLTASNKAYNMSSNIKDNSNWMLTSSESSTNKDSDSSNIIPNLGTSSVGDRDQFNNNNLAEGD